MKSAPRPAAKAGAATRNAPGGYVRFSDKLTQGLTDVQRLIQENRETIDTIQEIGLQLTSAIAALQSVALKYATIIDAFLDKIVPLIEKVPFIDAKIVAIAKNAQSMAQTVVDSCNNTNVVVTDVRTALTTADVGRLQAHKGDLQKLSKGLEAAVARLK